MMKNKLRYFVMTIILMIMGILPSKAMVVFNANEISNNTQKEGITITHLTSGDLSIKSSDKNIVMVGIKYPDYKYHEWWEEGGASNSFEYDNPSSPSKINTVQHKNDNSGSWEEWIYKAFENDEAFPWEEYSIGYKAWKGIASEVICQSNNYEKIFVYVEGDDLPQKSIFAMYEEKSCASRINLNNSDLRICYGYLDFLTENYSFSLTDFWYYYHYDVYYKVEKYPFYVDGRNQELPYADYVYFSLNDYKPESTSKWFKGASFRNLSLAGLNMSEVTDATEMFSGGMIEYLDMSGIIFSNHSNVSELFSGCSINYLDMSGMSFPNLPKVTGLFLGSSIKYLQLNHSVEDAEDDFFVGLGTESKPCYLYRSPKISPVIDINDSLYVYKGGYFYRPLNKAYVVSSGYFKKGEDYNWEAAINARRSINFCYDSLYLEKELSSFDAYYWPYSYTDGYTGDIDLVAIYESCSDVSCYDLNSGGWTSQGVDLYWGYNDPFLCPSFFPIKLNPSFVNAKPTTTSSWFDFSKNAYWEWNAANNSTPLDRAHNSQNKTIQNRDRKSYIGLSIDGLCYLNTSEVTNMSNMFGCTFSPFYNSVTSLDLSHFVTTKVKDMSSMFLNLCGPTHLDLSNFDTSNVTNMSKMFMCEPVWVGDNDSGHVFYDYPSTFTSIDVSHFNTSNVTDMSYMFCGSNNLTSLDIQNFDTSKNTNMSYMFFECGGLTSLDVSHFDTSNVKDMSYLFYGCSGLTTLDVSNFNTSSVTNMSHMFFECSGLTSLDVSSFDTSKLTEGKSDYMFAYCSSLKEIAISATMGNLDNYAFGGVGTPENPCEIYAPLGFDFGTDTNQPYFYWKGGYFKAKVETFAALSDDGKTLTFCYGIKPKNMGDNVYAFNTADTNPAWYSQRANITKVVFDPSFAYFKPTSTFGWFRGMENLEEIEGLEYLNTSETTLMSYMFYGCSKLKNIDVSHFDTKNVEKMGYMFQNCTNLESIDISNFDYTKNTSCYRMFNGCTNLKAINLGEWKNNTNNQYGYMFSGCSSLETLDLSQLNLPSDAKTTSMLNGCSSLRSLTISPSMSVLNSAACSGVGTATNPCDITAPDDFNYGVDTSVEPFRWKSGYFRLSSKLLAEASDVKIGNVYDLRISLRNGSHVYNGYQFNVNLPEGFDLTQKPREGYSYTLSNRYATTPSIRITPQDDGSYQVLAYSTNDATITGTEGLIITLPLTVEEGLAEGHYTGTITDVTFNNPDNTSAYLQDAEFNIFVPAFGLGDVNHDRAVNITDVMMTVNHVVGQTPSGFHIGDADVNGDHVVNISDIMAIVNLVVSAPTANAPAILREAMADVIRLVPTADGYAVSLKNNEPYTALQMDIQMPNGAPLNARLADNRSDGHTVICNDLGNGHHRIVVYSLNGHALKGNDGILLQIQTNGKHNNIPEIYDVQLTNRLFESVKLSDISLPTDISTINKEDDTDGPAYNVQGIRAPKYHRGIIIQDGRKRVEKK